MNPDNWEIINQAIKKGKIDFQMQKILLLLRAYNHNDEEWITDAMYHLALSSMKGDEEE